LRGNQTSSLAAEPQQPAVSAGIFGFCLTGKSSLASIYARERCLDNNRSRDSARGARLRKPTQWAVIDRKAMDLDTKKIDDAVLALLYLGVHDGARAWKGFDWEAMNRLHEKGYISEPRGKAKSVVFTEEGLERALVLLQELFGK
jgi:hypothetical protein